MLSTTPLTLVPTRPMSCTQRAKAYAQVHVPKKKKEEPSVTPLCELVRFQAELKEFDRRFFEPCIGTFMDARAAAEGKLYDFRAELAGPK